MARRQVATVARRIGRLPGLPPQVAHSMHAGTATLPPSPDWLLFSLYFRHCVGSELLPNSGPTFDTYRAVDLPAICECIVVPGFALNESSVVMCRDAR